ncbi:probable G-protein coupled receptor Mth-like 3 [Dreissena polymorpha]|uniref:G-protein coupled receptors family 2 profile 2 domain-containing protein n=1 Tax=Dreissena polymorpha TaxID=45954 RepID=A0A9D4HPV8_DREPO|nr:probable G-protein coupled receptor Mth-like 3 [Dreissena polymorpha]KAH3725203.1 hypothetical protein DPMN_051038 [Dreissena polymorpha]
MCRAMGDCCRHINHNFSAENIVSVPRPALFSCERISGMIESAKTYGVLFVTKCPDIWADQEIRKLCEENNHFTDDLNCKIPVSDQTEFQVMYRNMYCAFCNEEYDFLYWKAQYECKEPLEVRAIPGNPLCRLSFSRPEHHVKYRLCLLTQPLSTCPEESNRSLVEMCARKPYYVVYDDAWATQTYRNEYCAQCNGIQVDNIYCEKVQSYEYEYMYFDPDPNPVYSYRLLVDINNNKISDNTQVFTNTSKCEDNALFDVVYGKCRTIVCPRGRLPMQGRCIIRSKNDSDDIHAGIRVNTSGIDMNCTLVQLDKEEYTHSNDSRLFIIPIGRTITHTEYLQNDSEVFICQHLLPVCSVDCSVPEVKMISGEIEGYISLIGVIISTAALFLTLLVYISCPRLLNTPGKIMLCLVLSLLFAQITFIIASKMNSVSFMCTAIAVLIHYFFLAAFGWMNVIAFDLWKTFSKSFVTSGSVDKAGKRFRLYSIYAWGIPMILLGIALIIDQADLDINPDFKPRYGKGLCWFNSRVSLIVFFAGPLAVFKLFDIVSFVFTAVHIARANRQGARARTKKNACSLLINLKLSMVMGLTWVFAFLANISNNSVMWYLFILFNTLQGLFIAISFLCTRKVSRLVHEKFEVISSALSSKQKSSGTQLTSLAKSSE